MTKVTGKGSVTGRNTKLEKVKEKRIKFLSCHKGHGGYECPSMFIRMLNKILYIYICICIHIYMKKIFRFQ